MCILMSCLTVFVRDDHDYWQIREVSRYFITIILYILRFYTTQIYPALIVPTLRDNSRFDRLVRRELTVKANRPKMWSVRMNRVIYRLGDCLLIILQKIKFKVANEYTHIYL